MDVYFLVCPRCGKNFHCDSNLRGFAIPRHCPHCDLYFQAEEDKKEGLPKGTAFGSLKGIGRGTFYLPDGAGPAVGLGPPRVDSPNKRPPISRGEPRRRR